MKNTLLNGNIELSSGTKARWQMSETQLLICKFMKQGWILLREDISHKFTMHFEARLDTPFLSQIGTLYTTNVDSMLRHNIIKPLKKDYSKTYSRVYTEFVLTPTGENTCL